MARRRKHKKSSWMLQVLLIFMILGSVLFSSVTVVLVVGMVPTLVAAIVDRSPSHLRALSIAIMNFAGCSPFLYDVVKHGRTMEAALDIVLEPRTVVIIYFAAAMGYMINWSVTGIVSSIMVQKVKQRLIEIEDVKNKLIERWGDEVTGSIPLDETGHPVHEKNEPSV